MNAVFLDTVGLIALWDQADQWHSLASAAFGRLASARRSYVTTSFVLLECGNAASRRPYRSAVLQIKNAFTAANSLIVPTKDDWDEAWHQYSQGQQHAAGIVDCVSFVVMRRLGITEVFTNDQHFQDAGFVILF